MISDPVDLEVPALGDLVVSVYVPGDTGPATNHNVALHTTYIVKGDATAQSALTDAITSQSWYWLSGIEVLAPANAAAIVAFGDSITDGTRSTPNTDSSWPSVLARRLAANKATAQLGVLNQGIAANRVLRDDVGTSALGRFDRDVLAQNSVKWMFVLEGINDIRSGLGKSFAFVLKPGGPPKEEVTAEQLIGAYRQMITRAHEHGIKMIGGTLLPFEGAGNYSENGNAVRKAVNQWTRTGGTYDWVADFDSVVRDPEHPDHYRAEFDSGDHLHPSDAGYKAMAESIDLSIFGAPRTTTASNSRGR
jgi:lysophospholipase L1-like esterase